MFCVYTALPNWFNLCSNVLNFYFVSIPVIYSCKGPTEISSVEKCIHVTLYFYSLT